MGSNVPKIGADDIAGCYLGSDEIEKIYLGSDLVYENTLPEPEYWTTSFTWDRSKITKTNYQEASSQLIPSDKDVECFLKFVFNNATIQSSPNVLLHTGSGWNLFNTQWITGSTLHFTIDGSPWADTQINGLTIDTTSDTVYTRYKLIGNHAWYEVSRDKVNWTGVDASKSRSSGYTDLWFMRHASDAYPAPEGCYIDTTESYIKVDGKYMVYPYV